MNTDHFISYRQFIEKRIGMVADLTINIIFVNMMLFAGRKAFEAG